ncbi:MAG: lysozyme [Cyanobacteria bacterium P01_D01_bin.36]
MGTWIKETDTAFYLMEGGHYISKISKYPSTRNESEKVVNIVGMKAWFARADAPRGMTVSSGGPEPKAKPQPANDIASSSVSGSAGSSSKPAGSTAGPKRTNRNGLLLIKSFEGLRLRAYRDAVGIWTIGFGTTRNVRPGMSISEDQAITFLQEDLSRFEKAINDSVKVNINDNQFSALASFTYNVGPGAFRSSTMLRKLNAGDIRGAADEFPRWNKAGGRALAGLTRRRNAERLLFLGEDFHKFL